jgi:hypothetical protein
LTLRPHGFKLVEEKFFCQKFMNCPQHGLKALGIRLKNFNFFSWGDFFMMFGKIIQKVLILSGLVWETMAFALHPQEVFELINQYRAQSGYSPLVMTRNLENVAWYHSKDMCERNFFSHVNPSGQNGGARLKQWNISFQSWAENIYWGSGAYDSGPSAVQAWITSPDNRVKLLGAFDQIGIGVFQCPSGGRTFYTAVFIKVQESVPQPTGLFGAIAFSPSTGASGRSWNWRSQSEAEFAAFQACRQTPRQPQDCRNAVWMRDSCGAVAMDAMGRWGWGWNASVSIARELAIQSCGRLESCYLVASVCADGSGQGLSLQ